MAYGMSAFKNVIRAAAARKAEAEKEKRAYDQPLRDATIRASDADANLNTVRADLMPGQVQSEIRRNDSLTDYQREQTKWYGKDILSQIGLRSANADSARAGAEATRWGIEYEKANPFGLPSFGDPYSDGRGGTRDPRRMGFGNLMDQWRYDNR